MKKKFLKPKMKVIKLRSEVRLLASSVPGSPVVPGGGSDGSCHPITCWLKLIDN